MMQIYKIVRLVLTNGKSTKTPTIKDFYSPTDLGTAKGNRDPRAYDMMTHSKTK